MNDHLAAALRRATAAVRDGQPLEATALIRSALGIGPDAAAASRPPAAPRRGSGVPRVGSTPRAEAVPPPRERPTYPLGKVVETLKALRVPGPGRRPDPVAPAVPAGAAFLSRTFAGSTGSRDYRLYVPAPASGRPNGLVVMLHGCKQDPDDFAAGTGMNRIADTHGLVVAYPGQTRRANVAGCWNWFDPAHQRRGEGEPAIIAGLTEALRDEFGIAPGRVFVAGLSAGGAMAAVMAATYPELYAAAGIHSGLGYGAASGVMSALAAMRSGGASITAATGSGPRLIVVHGAADTTVAPGNAAAIFNAIEAASPEARRSTEHAAGARGRTEVVHRLHEGGTVVAEMRIVEGMGHAWAGGTSAGSYTDPAAPDASTAMVRFFLAPEEARPGSR